MKQTVIALFLTSTRASWGEWNRSAYCDYTQPKVNSENMGADYFYSTDECQLFCEQADQEASDIMYGDSLCCDYEQWEDGTYDCTLYNSGLVEDNEFPTQVDADGNIVGADF